MVHGAEAGVPYMFALDFIELKASHTGANMAAAIQQSLEEFGVEDKVSFCHLYSVS